MSTQAQINANRENAQKSSGPVTDQGKAASSQNRASHRLTQYASFQVLDHEDPSLYADLQLELMYQFQPDGEDEKALVERMTQHEWMRRRALTYQDQVFNEPGRWRFEQLKIFMRYESQHERAYNACASQLLKIRAEKRSMRNGFERQQQVKVQIAERIQRHEITQKARQVDIDCKIIRTLRTSANNPEALEAARNVKTRHQAA